MPDTNQATVQNAQSRSGLEPRIVTPEQARSSCAFSIPMTIMLRAKERRRVCRAARGIRAGSGTASAFPSRPRGVFLRAGRRVRDYRRRANGDEPGRTPWCSWHVRQCTPSSMAVPRAGKCWNGAAGRSGALLRGDAPVGCRGANEPGQRRDHQPGIRHGDH